MLILYGSETGTAEDVAYKLHSVLSLCSPRICSLEVYDVTGLPRETCIVFVVSTSGDGELPSGMRAFWQFLLRKSLASTSLGQLKMGVFGLGDSSYDKFNAAARKLCARLRQLGASEILPMGLGDDQAQWGYLTALNPWIQRLSEALLGVSGGGVGCSPLAIVPSVLLLPHPPLPEPEYTVQVVSTHVWSSKRARYLFPAPAQCKLAAGASPLVARVSANIRMTAPSWKQDVRHIKLNVDASLVPAESLSWPLFVAGDVATVHPCNPSDLVARAIRMALTSNPALLVTAEDSLDIVRRADYGASSSSSSCPGRKNRVASKSCTLTDLFARYLDIGGVPRRSFFEGLSAFASDVDEREKLAELSSAQGTDLYHEYCIKEKRNYVEVLEEFKSARPSLPHLLALIPPLQARHYSIASSGHVHPTELDLCVAVVDATTPYGRRRMGLCSSYLAALEAGDEVVLWVRQGAFHAPSPQTPVILVGPGTGVAPMRAVLQERRACGASAQSVLFFGCRRREFDFLFGDEWTSLCHEDKPLLKGGGGGDGDEDVYSNASVAVVTAFSQDGRPDQAKTYVMSKIKHHGRLLWELVQAGGCILVSGSAKRMPSDVRKAIRWVFEEHGGVDEAESGRILQRMEAQKLYVVEAWS